MKQSEKELLLAKGIITKIKSSSGDSGVARFFESDFKELPPIKLSPEEMESLKGGSFRRATAGLKPPYDVVVIPILVPGQNPVVKD